MPRALVAAIEGPGIPGEEPAHAPGEGAAAAPDEEMSVVREQRPGVDDEAALLHDGGESGDEVGAVGIAAEDHLAVEAAHHHMVEDAGGIEARLAGHGNGRVA
jgi:hypothetical protein